MNEYKGIMPTKIELTLEQSQQGVSNDVLAETGSIHNLSVFTKMNSDIEDDIMDPVMQCTTLPSHSSFSQKKLVSFITEIHTTSIDFLTPNTRYDKTPYELIKGRKPNVQYFHVFGSLCYPINDRDDLGKMKPKPDIGIFIGYSESSRGFRIYNLSNDNVDESVQKDIAELDRNSFYNPFHTHVFEEAEPSSTFQDPSNMHEFHQKHYFTDIWTKNNPIEQVTGDPSKPVTTRCRLYNDAEMCMYTLTVSTTEPTNIKEAMLDHNWIESMQDELN
ncbi:gag-pol polyprotein [Tanacetum coccineum]